MSIPENSNPYNMPPGMPVYRRNSTLAIVSLICGVATWFFIPVIGALVAVITGHLAKKEIRESNGALSGDGMAITGLVLGYIQLGFVVLGIIAVVVFLVAVSAGVTRGLTGPSVMAFFMV